jgi:hypothetical protein
MLYPLSYGRSSRPFSPAGGLVEDSRPRRGCRNQWWRDDEGVRGRRTAVAVGLVAVLVGGVTAGCRDDTSPERAAPTATPAAAVEGIDDETATAWTGSLEVLLVTGLRVIGIGCRAGTARDACTIDGQHTYRWKGQPRAATATATGTHEDTGFGTWVAVVRFARGERDRVQAAAEAAGGQGRPVLVLDAHSGDVLQEVAPLDVERGRIVVRDLRKPEAEQLVGPYVTAAAGR